MADKTARSRDRAKRGTFGWSHKIVQENEKFERLQMICRGMEHRAQHAAPLQAALLEIVQSVGLKTNHHLLFKTVLHKILIRHSCL